MLRFPFKLVKLEGKIVQSKAQSGCAWPFLPTDRSDAYQGKHVFNAFKVELSELTPYSLIELESQIINAKVTINYQTQALLVVLNRVPPFVPVISHFSRSLDLIIIPLPANLLVGYPTVCHL